MELLSSSTPTLNAPIVHVTLHYILLSVSAHVGARRRTSAHVRARRHRHQGACYLTVRFSAQLAINTCDNIEHLNMRLPKDGADVH